MSEATRRKVLAAAQALNYVPNSNARALAVANSSIIGISVPNLFNDVFADILLGMRRTFEHAGYSTLVQTTDYDPAREERLTEQLLAWRPAAVILTGIDQTPTLCARLQADRVPTLQVWDVTDTPIGICVGLDHYQAGADLGLYVANLGYKRAAFVGAPQGTDPRADRRFAGLVTAFETVHRTTVQRIAVEQGNSYAMGQSGINALQKTDRPDVVFFLNDNMAFGGMMAVERMGLSVPQDIGIVGFNDLDLTSVLPRTMTTMATPRRQMGLTGARNLLGLIHGVRPEPVTCLPCKLVPGQTTRQIG